MSGKLLAGAGVAPALKGGTTNPYTIVPPGGPGRPGQLPQRERERGGEGKRVGLGGGPVI